MINASDSRFGVELELVGLGSDEAAHVLDDCLGGTNEGREGWMVVDDPSIPRGFELRSPPLHFCDMPLLEIVFDHLRRAGSEPSPAHAGLHVHVETCDLSGRQLANLAGMWSVAEPSLRRTLDVHPRRALRYCRPIAPFARRLEDVTTIDDLLENWSDAFGRDAGSPAKQRSLNFESHKRRGTVEFRLFNSVASSRELRVCVALALDFTERARRSGNAVWAPTQLSRERRVAEHSSDRGDKVALITERRAFRAPTFHGLLQLLLDASFIDDSNTGWFERGAKSGESSLDRMLVEHPGEVHAYAAEPYARAAVERLASRGCGKPLPKSDG